MAMTTLVTGGGGFLGLYVVEQLVARGDTVRVFCRGDYPRLRELGVEVLRGDIRDAAAVEAACQGVETVFHTAAVPGVWGPWRMFYDTNTLGTRHVLSGCRTHGVRRLVYTSSPSVVFDGQPHRNADESLPYPNRWLCHYPHTKALAERDVLAANGPTLRTISLRPHLLWGPRDTHLIPRLIARAKAGRLRRVGDGTNLVSMSYVENAATAHLSAADALADPKSPAAGRAYFLNEPEPFPLWPWVDRLLGVAGLPPVTKAVSLPTAYRLGVACEAVWRAFRLPGEPPMTRFLALQLGQSHTYSVRAAERDFGYRPTIGVEEALRRTTPDLQRLGSL